MPRWLDLAKEPAADLSLAALLMEKAGTGGALFRNFFRDFLLEAREYLGASPALKQAQQSFAEAAKEWAAVAGLIEAAGRGAKTADLHEAAQRCLRNADLEVAGMRALARL